MASIIFLAIAVVIATALMASVTIHFLTPINDSGLSPLEQNCQQIANEGYKIHAMYSNSSPDELPNDVFERLMHIDNSWMSECVSVLPADSIFSIVNNVERNTSFGE